MGASFAKAIFHRYSKKQGISQEPSWGPGWSFAIKTDGKSAATFSNPSPEASETAAHPGTFLEESNPEDRS